VAGDARLRILEATYTCVARYGLAKTTVEDAARVSGMAAPPSTGYFRGGRDQLVAEVIAGRPSGSSRGWPSPSVTPEALDELLEEALFFATGPSRSTRSSRRSSRPSPIASCPS